MHLTSLCQPRLEHENPVFISLFIHLSTTGAHVAPTNVMGCIQPQTVLDLIMGCKDRWEPVPLVLAGSPHTCPTFSSWVGTEKTRIRKVWVLLYYVCCGYGSCPHSAAPLLIYTELSRHLSWATLLHSWGTQGMSRMPPRNHTGSLEHVCAFSASARSPRTQGAAPPGSSPWHSCDLGRKVTPQLINTPLVNPLCLYYSYQELTFPLHCVDDLRWRLGKQQNILDSHCILIADNLQIQARIWATNETPTGHPGWNDTISNTCLVPTYKVTFWNSQSLQGPYFAKVSEYKSLCCICKGYLTEVITGEN